MDADLTTEEPEPLEQLVTEVRGLRTDVQRERRGRRLTTRLAVVVVFAIGIYGSGYVANQRAEKRNTARQACETRTGSRADVRAAIRAAVDEVATFADVPAVDRERLAERVADRVYRELPPPSC